MLQNLQLIPCIFLLMYYSIDLSLTEASALLNMAKEICMAALLWLPALQGVRAPWRTSDVSTLALSHERSAAGQNVTSVVLQLGSDADEVAMVGEVGAYAYPADLDPRRSAVDDVDEEQRQGTTAIQGTRCRQTLAATSFPTLALAYLQALPQEQEACTNGARSRPILVSASTATVIASLTLASLFVHADAVIGPPHRQTPTCPEGGRIADGRPDLPVPSPQYGRSYENVAVQGGPSRKQVRGPKIGRWSDATLKSAIAAVEAGGKVKTVSRYFDTPASSFSDHLYGRTLGRKRGPPTILKHDEERALTTYMGQMQDYGQRLSM